MNKLRWGKFYWSDWADDPALALCSLAAQGLWMRLLCIAAQGTPYGHVTINGKPATIEQLGRLVRNDWIGHPTRYVARLIAELERNGVAARSESGCLISRRMERDGQLARVRHAAAEQSWKRRAAGQQRASNGPDAGLTRASHGPVNGPEKSSKPAENSHSDNDLHMQNPDFASIELDTELDADPHTPKPKSRRGKKGGAWTGHAIRGGH